jgi:hypothetical protein
MVSGEWQSRMAAQSPSGGSGGKTSPQPCSVSQKKTESAQAMSAQANSLSLHGFVCSFSVPELGPKGASVCAWKDRGTRSPIPFDEWISWTVENFGGMFILSKHYTDSGLPGVLRHFKTCTPLVGAKWVCAWCSLLASGIGMHTESRQTAHHRNPGKLDHQPIS